MAFKFFTSRSSSVFAPTVPDGGDEGRSLGVSSSVDAGGMGEVGDLRMLAVRNSGEGKGDGGYLEEGGRERTCLFCD
jgi:hypothetical protein